MITSNKGPATTKTLQGFKISHHIEKLKDSEVPLDLAQAIYSPHKPIINFTSPMYRGDELKITLPKADIEEEKHKKDTKRTPIFLIGHKKGHKKDTHFLDRKIYGCLFSRTQKGHPFS